jgi:hypothetical protein
MNKMLRVIRLDPSDAFVFERAAEAGEWAVPGSLLWDEHLRDLPPKGRAAFRSGFLGLGTLGFATLVEVAEIAASDRAVLVERFAGRLSHQLGAPDRCSALAAAQDEIAFAMSLCDHEPGTVIAMHRTIEGGAIREQFRTLRPRDSATPGADRLHSHARAFEIVEVDEAEERVDLVDLRGKG